MECLLRVFKRKNDCVIKKFDHLNSLWPSDAIWQHRYASTLAQVMAWCLVAPSHYLSRCWLIISEVLWHSHESNCTGNAQDICHLYQFENIHLRAISHAILKISVLHMSLKITNLRLWPPIPMSCACDICCVSPACSRTCFYPTFSFCCLFLHDRLSAARWWGTSSRCQGRASRQQ